MKNQLIYPANILLPAADTSLARWAVVAVDQFTSEPEYWQAVEQYVGDAPSTLRLVLPEIHLSEAETRLPALQTAMRDDLARGVLEERVHGGYVLVERATSAGARVGLIARLDLEKYDYAPGAQSLIRATEGTVLERVPPRVRMRRGAALELPHVLMLLDDARQCAIEPLYAQRSALELLYDKDPARLRAACETLGGEALPGADVSYALPFFEDLRIAVQFWHGDEEFSPRLRFLWDAAADQYLRYETMYYALGLLRTRLQALG